MTPAPSIWERALTARGHVVLEASAGTGKTYTLEHLIVAAVAGGTRLEQILVVTFTEKAARELRERVRRRLSERVAELEASGRAVDGPGSPAPESPLGRLREALLSFDQATISTIHGFCQRVLTRHAFEGGRPLEQSLADGRAVFRQVAVGVLREALAWDAPVARWLEAALAEDSVDELVAQLRACHAERAHLAPRPVDPGRALGACAAVDPDAVSAALAGVLPLHNGVGKALVIGARIMAEAARTGEVGEAMAWLAGEWAHKLTGPDGKTPVPVLARLKLEPLQEELPAVGALLDAMGALDGVRSTRLADLAHALLPTLEARLAEHKARQGLFDFDDLVLLVRDALREPHRGGALRASLRGEYVLALIDEFQDTDAAQWEIFETLFFDRSDGHRLVVVGDPKQAIYGFRGADVHTYLRARAQIRADGGEVLSLDTCYRATPEVIAGYNALFQRDFFSPEGGLDYAPVACGRPELRLRDTAGPAAGVVGVALSPDAPDPGLPALRTAWLDFLVAEIRHLTGPEGPRLVEGSGTEGGATRGVEGRVTPGDIKVLARSAQDARAVAQALRRHRIPHAYYRQAGLLSSAEAEDVAALLAALARPDSPAVRLAAWLTPFFDLGVSQLEAARELPPEHPLVERLTRWRTWAQAHRWERLFDDALHAAGLARRLLFAEAGERRLTNYLHLFDLLLAEVHGAPLTAAELAARVAGWVAGRRTPAGAADPDMQRLDTERAAVQILTMHMSKGLEAPVVFLVGAWGRSNRTPKVRVFHRDGVRVAWAGEGWGEVEAAVAAEQAQEDERLMYVALTRAAGRLYLPLVPLEERRFNGGYRRVVERLRAITASGDVPGWLSLRTHQAGVAAGGAAPPVPSLAQLEVPLPEPTLPDLDGARRRGAPVLVTSYSRMKSGFERHRVAEGAEARLLRDEGVEEAGARLDAAGLPGGKGVGIFLHEVLEQVDFSAADAASDGASWLADPQVDGLLRRLGTRHDIDPVHLPEAGQLIWRALATPLDAQGLSLPRGLRAVGRRVPEMPFTYPIPERGHPLLAQAAEPAGRLPFGVGRGFIQGVVDLVFEHAGRFWLLDWKSDRLPDYGPAPVAAHVEAAYRDQARIYSLAVLRALGLHTPADHAARFGGVVYVFLRGLDAAGRGLWAHRPSWEALCDWERWLLEKDAGGWGVPPDRVLEP